MRRFVTAVLAAVSVLVFAAPASACWYPGSTGDGCLVPAMIRSGGGSGGGGGGGYVAM